MRNLFVSACLVFCLSSCSFYQIDSNSTSPKLYPPKASVTEVTYIYEVTQPHLVIGQVTINTERIQPLTKIVDKMKYEAAMIGGDAITNIRTNSGTGKWAKVKSQKLFGNANIRSNFIADVIVFQ